MENEKEHTLQRLRDREANLGQQSRELQSRILELEERCQGSAKKVLQDVAGGVASATTSKKMQEEATCSICLHLMAKPMSINCGHSYCRACRLRLLGLGSSSRSQLGTGTFSCPQCRAPFQRGSLRPNQQLGSLIAALRELEQELSRQEHGERLHLFCKDEGQLICWRCEHDPRHKGHATALVEDTAPATGKSPRKR
ncbi:Tripartite motif-containing protein 38 [Myotis brandtii]|uniref:Tripartite motif-containing protein 38 n=1 Tax=Myotis brandtii TaxID=109478 RepID=S7MFT7_MYOBR|nr:Tripartite motif-containing protein 38 [Myotis brandtii]